MLERAGTRVLDEDGLRLLRESGCQVSDANLVRIPSWLIKSSLATAPERITLAGRDRSRRITLERNKTYFGTGSDCRFILDPHTDERRRPTLEDLRHAAIVSEASPNIDFHMSLGLASDLPISSGDGRQLLAMLQGTAKPLVVTATGEDGLADQYELACRVLGSPEEFARTPLFAVYIKPDSSPGYSSEAVAKALYAAEAGIPAIFACCGNGGYLFKNPDCRQCQPRHAQRQSPHKVAPRQLVIMCTIRVHMFSLCKILSKDKLFDILHSISPFP